MYFRGKVIDEIVNAYEIEGTGWTNYTFHHDNLQSVLGLSGHDGQILQAISYDPFGNTTSITGSSNNNQLHYTGRETDPDTGLINYRVRIYDPTIGRFCTEDPLGFKAGVNFYVYASNNPINYNDPYGFTAMADTLGYLSAGANTFALATIWNPALYGPAKTVGTFLSVATVFNAGYEYKTGQISGTQLAFTAGTEAANFIGGFAAKPVEAFVSGITRGVGIADTTVGTVQDFAAAYNKQNGATNPNVDYSSVLPILSNNQNSTPLYNELVNPMTSGSTNAIATTPTVQQNTTSSSSSNAASFNLPTDTSSAAEGGYLIYPNKPNTNMAQSVYRK